MTYSSIAITAGIFSFVSGAVLLFLTIKVFIKYKEKRNQATLLLAISIMAWVFTCFFASSVYIIAYTNINLARIL